MSVRAPHQTTKRRKERGRHDNYEANATLVITLSRNDVESLGWPNHESPLPKSGAIKASKRDHHALVRLIGPRVGFPSVLSTARKSR